MAPRRRLVRWRADGFHDLLFLDLFDDRHDDDSIIE